MKEKMENLEKILNAIKSAFIILLYTLIAVFFMYNYKLIATKFREFSENFKIERLNLGLIELVSEQKKTIETALNEASKHKGTSDTIVNETQKVLIKSLVVTNQELSKYERVQGIQQSRESYQQKWVYVGSFSKTGNNWSKKYVTFEGGIERGATGKSLGPVNVRNSSPVYTDSEGWVMGKVIDGLDQYQEIKVLDVAVVPGTNNMDLYWVKIE